MMPPVIILAGGLGTRLRSVTHDKIPKPMVPVAYQGEEYPFLSFMLSSLYNRGIRKIIICIDHLSEQLTSYFGDGQGIGMQILYDNAGPVLTAARVKHAMEKTDASEVIIHCGDVFHPLDMVRFIQNFHDHPENLMQISVYKPVENGNAEPNLTIDEKSQVVAFKKKASGDNNRVVLDAGVLIVRRSVLSYIPDSPDASLTEDLYPALIEKKTVGAYESESIFYDIGTPSEYSRFCSYVEYAGINPIDAAN